MLYYNAAHFAHCIYTIHSITGINKFVGFLEHNFHAQIKSFRKLLIYYLLHLSSKHKIVFFYLAILLSPLLK